MMHTGAYGNSWAENDFVGPAASFMPASAKVKDGAVVEPGSGRDGLRLLLVDDDEAIVDLLEAMVKNHNMITDRAFNGKEAQEKIMAGSYDLVITDISMPEMNGIELLKWIRSYRADLKVITISGDHSNQVAGEAKRLGAVDYLFKPFKVHDVLGAIDRTFAGAEKDRPEVEDPSIFLLKQSMHDVRSAMVNISIMLKMLQKGYYGKLDFLVARQLDAVAEKVLGLTDMSEQYCKLAMSLGKKEEITFEPLDLQEDVINAVLGELQLEIRNRKARIVHQKPASPAASTKIRANRHLLQALFRILFDNAVKYCEEINGTIRYSIKSGRGYLLAEIENDGKSVPAEMKERIFDEFVRQDETQPGPAKGMGIGLALAKSIVLQHGGEIRCEPREDVTRFVVRLPIGGGIPATYFD